MVWVYAPDGRDVGAEMLKAGLAWHFTEYDKSQKYAELEEVARKDRTGLWADKNPIVPWDYRKNKNR